MKRFMKLYQVEQKLFFRSGDVFAFNLCMPIVTMLLIGFIAGSKTAGDSGMTYLQSAFASVSSVGICCSAFMSIPIVLVDYREKKILKHFYCSPCSPVRIMAVDVISSAVMSLLSAAGVGLTAYMVFDYRMDGSLPAFIGAWCLTLVSMFSIGLLVASLCKTAKSMSVVTTILYFPMLLFSGATIPLEIFPKGVQALGEIMPLGVGIRLMKNVSMGIATEGVAAQAIVLAVIAVVCSFVAIKTFRWE